MGEKKTIFITGSSGFVGSAIVRELRLRGINVRALVRKARPSEEGLTFIAGDLFDDSALNCGMSGASAVIHLVGIIRENRNSGQTFQRIHTEAAIRVMEAAQRNRIDRYLHMSALGADAQSRSDYAITKYEAERYLQKTSLDYTIFRPSLIIGHGGEFTKMLADWANYRKAPWLFMPYFGNGFWGQQSAKVQPIRLEDVVRSFVDAIDRKETIRQRIDLVGPVQMDWPGMYQKAAQVYRGKKRLTLGLPIGYARILTQIVPAKLLPFNRAQVELAAIDNVSDVGKMQQQLGFSPQPIRFE